MTRHSPRAHDPDPAAAQLPNDRAAAEADLARRVLRAAYAVAAAVVLVPTAALAAEGMGGAVDPSVYRLMVFVMAIFVGYYVVWS
ncbi:MAG TPA: NAD(P) transhydrogenase subunit alpha, partial [Hyphomicrobium sp.]|nr:NAD(P) transhydrogenase subunit alpha [Hyphomicrobium sp.]